MPESEAPLELNQPDFIAWFVDRSKQWERFLEMLAGETEMGAMLVSGEEKMGKTFLINKMAYHCRQEQVPLVHVDFHDQKATNFLWLARQVREQLKPFARPDSFNRMTELINQFTDPAMAGISGGMIGGHSDLSVALPGQTEEIAIRVDLSFLRSSLLARFNLEELHELARSIHVLPDDIPALTRSGYASELVAYCQRRALVADLVVACESRRPFGDWWSEPPAGDGEGERPAPTSGRVSEVIDQGRDTLPSENRVLALAQSQIDNALCQSLERISESRKVALLFDTYDEATDEAEGWLEANLLDPIGRRIFTNLVLIVAGRPPLPEAGSRVPYVAGTTLQPFTVEHIREYLEDRRGIRDEDPEDLFRFTKGKPGLLAGIAENLIPAPSGRGDDW